MFYYIYFWNLNWQKLTFWIVIILNVQWKSIKSKLIINVLYSPDPHQKVLGSFLAHVTHRFKVPWSIHCLYCLSSVRSLVDPLYFWARGEVCLRLLASQSQGTYKQILALTFTQMDYSLQWCWILKGGQGTPHGSAVRMCFLYYFFLILVFIFGHAVMAKYH